MMLRSRWSHQSTLLERYLGALGSSRRVQPPAELDPGLAELAGYLHATRQRLQPPAAFVDTLRRNLEASAGDVAPLDHSWRGPTIDRRRPAPPLTPVNDEPGIDFTLSRVADTPGEVPLPISHRLAHEWLRTVAAILVFLVVGTLLVLVLRDEPNDDNVAGPVQTVSTASAVTLPVVEPTITTIPANEPWRVAVGAGSIWVTNDREGTVSRIDPATNSIVATIEVARPGNNSANAIAADDTSVWVVAGVLNLTRIDPSTNEVVATYPIDEPVDRLAIGDDALWVQSTDSVMLRRFDLTTNTFTASIDIALPQQTIVAGGAVWVIRDAGRGTDSEILKIDTATATVVAAISLGSYYSIDVQAFGNSLWVPTNSALLRIDMATTQVTGIYPLPEPISHVPLMTAGDGQIWVCNCTAEPDDVVWQFDVDRLEWSAEIPVENLEWEGWLAYLDGAIWGYNQNEVIRIQLPE